MFWKSFVCIYLLTFCRWVRLVAGHGFVHSVVIGGQTYSGWNPFSDPYKAPAPRVVRKVGSDGFVAASDVDLACHHLGDVGVDAVAEAPAGSEVVFQWAYWPGDHQGPVSTYMASCDGDCTTFSANNARWFKLDDAGYLPEERRWAADKLRADDNSWTSTIPEGLAPGDYLIRNEIVALHSITPQFYPSCSQVRVTGSGTRYPSSGDLVTMREVYDGAQWPNIYLSADLSSFKVPGPPPASLDGTDSPPTQGTRGGGSASSTRTASASATLISGSPTATRTLSPASQQQQCFLASRRLARRRVDRFKR